MEPLALPLERRLEMQRYIKDHISVQQYYDLQEFVNEMAEMRGIRPTSIEELVDESISPNSKLLTYTYNKVQEHVKRSARQLRDNVQEYLRSYLRIKGTQAIFDLIEITRLDQETIANILSGDDTVPLEDIAAAYETLRDHIQTKTEEPAKAHK